MNMTMEMKDTNVYGAGGFGSPSTGAEGGGRPGPPASLSIDRESTVVDRQATVFSTTTGEEASGAGTSSASAPGVWSGVPDGAPGPSGTASVDAHVTLSDDNDSDSSSTVSVASVRSDAAGPGAATGRKRGRPPTTGEYAGLAEAKKRLLELTLQERQIRLEAAVEDPAVRPRPVPASCKPLPSEAELAEEMRRAPTADLGAVFWERVAVSTSCVCLVFDGMLAAWLTLGGVWRDIVCVVNVGWYVVFHAWMHGWTAATVGSWPRERSDPARGERRGGKSSDPFIIQKDPHPDFILVQSKIYKEEGMPFRRQGRMFSKIPGAGVTAVNDVVSTQEEFMADAEPATRDVCRYLQSVNERSVQQRRIGSIERKARILINGDMNNQK
ncbi:hypothetical protein WN55_02393 [Dufourea novaeangliae]|uniref:Uncharacterized protein n=1 Tax=Dufourea novaeangliae TaxID=178035 RepID=A0A154PFQ3_DUFNO|nr:hypothetical protein WN55_02393 [Dufourea novaeangliae]